MKPDLIRRPNATIRVTPVLISILLSVGILPMIATGVLGLFVAWMFSIFHPLIFIAMTLAVALWVVMGLIQILMLFDIAVSRPGLSVIRSIGGFLFVLAGWGVAYFLIEDNAGSHFYSPMSSGTLIAVQCSVVFPPLVPITSFILGRRGAWMPLLYAFCCIFLWWWGATGFPSTLESITHSNAKKQEREGHEVHAARMFNRSCVEKVRAIHALDPASDARRIFATHGEVYLPRSATYSFMRFPGLPEDETGEELHQRLVDITNAKLHVIESLPDCLIPPQDDGGWTQMRYTEPIKKRFNEERDVYLSAFNREVFRLSDRKKR